jgi:hypothetical protein
MTALARTVGAGPVDMLPIPTDGHLDLCAVLRASVITLGAQIDVVVGPDDAGKSALLRTLAADHRAASHDLQLIDLSITNWRDLSISGIGRMQALLIDHIDRINDREHLSVAFGILDRLIPLIFAAGSPSLVLTFGQEWRDTFRSIFRLNPETLLQRSVPFIPVKSHYIRPYDDSQLTALCQRLGLNPHDFAEPSLRRPGVLAMAAAAASEPFPLNGANLRTVLMMRWVQAGSDASTRKARKAMWSLMGSRILRDGEFRISLPDLFAEFNAAFSTETLRNQVGGPLQWKEDQLQPDSPSWGDVAGAEVLAGIIQGSSTTEVRVPLRSTVLDALVNLSERPTLARQVEQKLLSLQGADFAETGSLGAALASLLTQISTKPELTFDRLNLQGPDHRELRSVERAVAELVEGALSSSLQENIAELLTQLRSVVHETVSGYRGGYECWAAVRAWARKLPLRATAEDVVSQLLPHDGSWHYEDILDVSVTRASTRLMTANSKAFAEALQGHVSPINEYLADIWDGINDGAWDQISETSKDFISSLELKSDAGKILNMKECGVQRARLASQDVQHWRLTDCDLFLADFRSCRNLEKTDLSGSNWWSAILPPPARYHLSRSCDDSRFYEWCEAPPWSNPYFEAQWPTPFD